MIFQAIGFRRSCAYALLGVMAFFLAPSNVQSLESQLDSARVEPDPPARVAPQTCPESKAVDLRRQEIFRTAADIDIVRNAAIRMALLDALQMVTGAEIARGTQSTTRSTLSSLEHQTNEHIVVRGGGRILNWEVREESIDADADGSGVLTITLDVTVCLGQSAQLPMVIAFEYLENALPNLSRAVRQRLIEAFATHGNLEPVREDPSAVYHDIRIALAHNLTRETVDNTAQAAILQQFGAGLALSESSMQYEMLTMEATITAVRFVDQRSISDTAVRRLRLPIGSRTEQQEMKLAIEAFDLAGQALSKRLGSGELHY
jgi:hypothetical protein